jgi:hypothetical protein
MLTNQRSPVLDEPRSQETDLAISIKHETVDLSTQVDGLYRPAETFYFAETVYK